MVSIAYDKTTENLLITIGGDNFRDLVDFLKENYCRWNPDMKAWTLHVTRYNDFLAELQTMGEVADIDMLSQSQIEDYFKDPPCSMQSCVNGILLNTDDINPKENVEIVDGSGRLPIGIRFAEKTNTSKNIVLLILLASIFQSILVKNLPI